MKTDNISRLAARVQGTRRAISNTDREPNLSRKPHIRTGGYTRVPNHLFDDLLPVLTDGELRVFLIILRSTEGFCEPGTGKRKERDWISHSQLRRRTGRGGAAVSAAVKGLTTRGLVVAEDVLGKRLATTEERRRHFGRLYYRVSPSPSMPLLPLPPYAKSENN